MDCNFNSELPFPVIDFLQLPEDLLIEEQKWHKFICSQFSFQDRIKQEISLTFWDTFDTLYTSIYFNSQQLIK